MQPSTDRILTTHVGSLPRPPDLQHMLQLKHRGEPYDEAVFESCVKEAVAAAVRKQVAFAEPWLSEQLPRHESSASPVHDR